MSCLFCVFVGSVSLLCCVDGADGPRNPSASFVVAYLRRLRIPEVISSVHVQCARGFPLGEVHFPGSC